MHRYDRHIGDYIRDTAHLSDLEDLAYRRLLDLYYLDEKPIGTDLVSVARKVRMATPDGVAVIESVLREFFTEQPDGWHQKRADEEIAAYRNRVISARINGEKGGRPPGKTGRKPKNNRTGSDPLTGTKPKRKLTIRLPPTDHSVAKATGAAAPPEDPDPVFGVALQFLLRKGIKEANARSYLGLMRKKHGDALVIEVATKAEQEDVSEPLGWMRKAMEARSSGSAHKPAKLERALNSIRRTHDALRGNQQGDADDARALPAGRAGG